MLDNGRKGNRAAPLTEWRCFCSECWRRFWAHRETAPRACPFCGSKSISANPTPPPWLGKNAA